MMDIGVFHFKPVKKEKLKQMAEGKILKWKL